MPPAKDFKPLKQGMLLHKPSGLATNASHLVLGLYEHGELTVNENIPELAGKHKLKLDQSVVDALAEVPAEQLPEEVAEELEEELPAEEETVEIHLEEEEEPESTPPPVVKKAVEPVVKSVQKVPTPILVQFPTNNAYFSEIKAKNDEFMGDLEHFMNEQNSALAELQQENATLKSDKDGLVKERDMLKAKLKAMAEMMAQQFS